MRGDTPHAHMHANTRPTTMLNMPMLLKPLLCNHIKRETQRIYWYQKGSSLNKRVQTATFYKEGPS